MEEKLRYGNIKLKMINQIIKYEHPTELFAAWRHDIIESIKTVTRDEVSEGKLKHATLARAENLSEEEQKKMGVKEGLVVIETRETPATKKYLIYVCPKCKNQLSKSDMGHQCGHCGEWQYHDFAEEDAYIK